MPILTGIGPGTCLKSRSKYSYTVKIHMHIVGGQYGLRLLDCEVIYVLLKCRLGLASESLLLSLETPNGVQSVA